MGLLFFKQYMVYLEKNMENYGKAMAVPAVPLPTALKEFSVNQSDFEKVRENELPSNA